MDYGKRSGQYAARIAGEVSCRLPKRRQRGRREHRLAGWVRRANRRERANILARRRPIGKIVLDQQRDTLGVYIA